MDAIMNQNYREAALTNKTFKDNKEILTELVTKESMKNIFELIYYFKSHSRKRFDGYKNGIGIS